MKPPAGSQPPPSSPAPAPSAPAPASPPQKPPTQSNVPLPTGTSAARGEDFDISTLPASSANGNDGKKLFPAQWNHAWIVVAALLAAYCLWFFAYGMGNRAQKPLPIGPIITNSAVAPATTVTVHVAGAVARPGVYSLGASARIADALTQAGGATPDADTTNLNLAAFVQDGAQIVVPVQAAPPSISPPPPVSNSNTQPAPPGIPSPPTGQLPAPTGAISPSAVQKAAQIDYLRAHPIDLNQASSFELQQLPGIGPAITTTTVTLF